MRDGGDADGLGLVPVLGELFDLLNAGWYAAEGDKLNAAWSAAAMVPFAGVAATAGKWGMRAADAVESAYQIAKAGGRHSGFLGNDYTRATAEIERAIASIEKRVADHEGWIANPESKIPDFGSLDPRQQAALVNEKWPGDIVRQKEHLAILRGILHER